MKSNVIVLIMPIGKITLKKLKEDFLLKLETIKNILMGERALRQISENPELISPTYPLNFIADAIKNNLGDTDIINDLQAKIPEVSLNKRGDIILTISTGEYRFHATCIADIISLSKKEYPVNLDTRTYPKVARLPKVKNYVNYSCYCENPADHKAELEKAHYNHNEALREVDLFTNLFNSAQINGATDYDKTRLAISLKGAKERVEIFKDQLNGAITEYDYAKENYATNKIKAIINAELGEDHLKKVDKLNAELIKDAKKVDHINRRVKYQSKQDKLNLQAHREVRDGINEKLAELYKIKEALEIKYITKENRELFESEFIN